MARIATPWARFVGIKEGDHRVIGGSLSMLAVDAPGVVAALSGVPGITGVQLVGAMTPEMIGASDVQRFTARFRFPALTAAGRAGSPKARP